MKGKMKSFQKRMMVSKKASQHGDVTLRGGTSKGHMPKKLRNQKGRKG